MSLKRKNREALAINYLAECVRTISKNTALIARNNSEYIDLKYSDLTAEQKQPQNNAEDIVKQVIANSGLEVVD